VQHFTPERDDRASLQALLIALDASPLALRRERYRDTNERGDWRINGRRGHVYADRLGYLLYVGADSARHWGFIKKRLTFCQLNQDGDDEGCLHLGRVPTKAEAELIREAIGVRKRRKLTEEGRAQLEGARRAANSTFRAQAFV
jgi:hypothetical protein